MSRAVFCDRPRRGISSSRPEGAVDHHAVGALIASNTGGVIVAQPRRVEQRAAARAVGDRDADVVARDRPFAVRRIRRGLARQRQRAKATGRRRPAPGTACRRARCAAARRRSSARARAAPGCPGAGLPRPGRCTTAAAWRPRSRRLRRRTRALAQHEEAGRVVDLPVHQHHAGDRRVAQAARRLQHRVAADLLEHVGRGVEQHAVDGVVGPDEDRRLRARLEARAAGAHAGAVGQLQFHCGKPPPAAAPSTVMRMCERRNRMPEERRPGVRPGRRRGCRVRLSAPRRTS